MFTQLRILPSAGTALLLCMTVLPVDLIAAPGDELIITGAIVNLREQADADASVLLKLARGRVVLEIKREGDWVEVYTERDDISTGWVHTSLLAPLPGNNTALTNHSDAYERFLGLYTRLNESSRLPDGTLPFTRIEEYLNQRLRITASSAWLLTEQAAREQILADLFKFWGNAVGPGLSAEIVIVDLTGAPIMRMFR